MSAGSGGRSLERRRVLTLVGVAALALVLVGTVLLLSGSSAPGGSLYFIDSPFSNVDVSNTRHASGPIRDDTVPDLELAWSRPSTAQGDSSYVASPVVDGDIVYAQDVDSNVQAIELGSGKLLWEKPYESRILGPNGLVVANGHVYGATATAAFALDKKTGKAIWSTTLAKGASEQVHMAPGYHDGLVYVSTAPAHVKGGGIGVLWALNAKTGKKVWSFDTVPKGLWGNPKVNFGGGLSYAPAFDAKGSMYFGVGNAGPIAGSKRYPWGSSRPGPNLYTNSVVKLDARTGKLQWYYQVTPHSLCNWDVGAPVLVKAGGRNLVIAGALSGIVVALDRQSGKPVWRRAVGIHNGHDNDGLQAMRGDYSKLKTPMTVYPGVLGGVHAPLAVSGSTVFVPVVNSPTLLVGQTKSAEVGPVSGELVAVDAATGAVEWKHRFKPTYSFGAALLGAVTTVNDLVFATTFGGTMHAFDSGSGAEIWTTSLPGVFNAGITISGGTLLAPAGNAEEGQTPVIAAYRLPAA